MTLEQLIGMGPDDWEKLNDKELEVICAPWFHITRPEMVAKATSSSKQLTEKEKKRQELRARAAQIGLDLEGILD